MPLRLALALAIILGAAPAYADRAAVLVLPGPGGDRAAAMKALPSLARRSARAVQERLDRAAPPSDALARLESARAAASEQMASFTELDRAEAAVAVALAAAFDALPNLDDVSIPVRLAFDLATVRLALGDRDGAGEALGLSARLDPAVAADSNEHPPALQNLANEVRPPEGSPPVPLPVARTRALGGLLGVDVLVIARAAIGGGVDVFVVRAFDGVATMWQSVPRGGRFEERLHARLVELNLARPAPEGSIGGPRNGSGGGSGPWSWLVPTMVGVAAAAGLIVWAALPPARDDARVVPGWQ
jgi:hypothetical protein